MVHQHFMLIPVMTVAENIVLGRRAAQAACCSTSRRPRARVRELSERYGLAVDPDARVEDVSVGQQQRVEILRALYRGAQHPRPRRADRGADRAGGAATSSACCAALKDDGTAIVFISHKLNEVLDDRRPRDRAAARQARRHRPDRGRRPRQSLARLMVGREVAAARRQARRRSPSEPVLEVARPARARRPRAARPSTASTLDGPRGRDRRAGRASTATARAS